MLDVTNEIVHLQEKYGSYSMTHLLTRIAALMLALGSAVQGVNAQEAGQGSPQADVPANPFNQSQVRKFNYDDNGVLTSEITEPGLPQSCMKTTYGYGATGNLISTTRANCAGASGRSLFTSRAEGATFGGIASQPITVNDQSVTVRVPGGLFPTVVTNSLSHEKTATFDPRFGAVLTQTSADKLSMTTIIDDFGRPVRVVNPDGTSTVTHYCLLSAPDGDLSSNSPQCPTLPVGQAPAGTVSFTHTEPRDTNDARMGAYVREFRDRLGRPVRVVTESADIAGQPAQLKSAAIASDKVYDEHGMLVLATQPYFISTGASTLAATNAVGVVKKTYDSLARVIRTDTASESGEASVTFGGAGPVSYGNYGSQPATSVTVQYEGMAQATTNAFQQKRRDERNANGDVVRSTDPSGAQVVRQFDAFGRAIQIVDALQHVMTNVYNVRGLKVESNDPDKGRWRYDFDALGQLVWQESPSQRAGAQATTFNYDKLGRLTQRSEPEFISNWYYDKFSDGTSCMGSDPLKGAGLLCEVTTGQPVDRRTKTLYDAFARVVGQRTDIISGGRTFATGATYDSVTGRVSTKTYPTGLSVRNDYSTYGITESLKLVTPVFVDPLPNAQGQKAATQLLPAGTVLWRLNALNALGVSESETLSNGVVTRRTLQPRSTAVSDLTAGLGVQTSVVNQHYDWDALGNLTGRTDNIGTGGGDAVTESFSYVDGLDVARSVNRLTSYTVSSTAMPELHRTVRLQYNALGMTLAKSDVGLYAYRGAGKSHPRAPSVVAGATYGYDENGNVVSASSGKYASLTYTSFDRVLTATGPGMNGSTAYAWHYDANHFRVKEVRTIGGTGPQAGQRVLWYVHPDAVGGLFFESEENLPSVPSGNNPAVTSNRHFLSTASGTVGTLVTTGALPAIPPGAFSPVSQTQQTTANKLEFWHRDHLGSLIATTDHSGAVTARYSYDPYGKRRNTTGGYDADGSLVVDWSPSLNAGTGRGFTAHEALDDIGLVNMNGRVFDANIGIFIQADPRVPHPNEPSGFSRYSYALGNPLNATDPSGFVDGDKDGYPKEEVRTVEINCGGCRIPKTSSGHLAMNWSMGAIRVSVRRDQANGVTLRVTFPAVVSGNVAAPKDHSTFERGFFGFAEQPGDNFVEYLSGHYAGQLVTGSMETAAMLWDASWGALQMATKGGVSQGTVRSTLGQALSEGRTTWGAALKDVLMSPAAQVVEIRDKLMRGDKKAALMLAPIGLAPRPAAGPWKIKPFSPRYSKGKEMFSNHDSIVRVNNKPTVDGAFSLWSANDDDLITLYHGSNNPSQLAQTGFTDDFAGAVELGTVFTSPNFSHAASRGSAGIFQFDLRFGDIKALQATGEIVGGRDMLGPEVQFKTPRAIDLLNAAATK